MRALTSLRIMWIRARRSPALAGIPLLWAASVWLAFQHQQNWLGRWINTGLALNSAAGAVLCPLTAVIAAWLAGDARRTGQAVLEDAAARGRSARLLSLLATVCLWALPGYAAMTALAFWQTAQVNPAGEPPWDLLALNAAFLVFGASIGIAVGSLWPRKLVPVVLGAVLYFGGAMVSYDGRSRTGLLYPVFGERWDPIGSLPGDLAVGIVCWLLLGGLSLIVVLSLDGTQHWGGVLLRGLVVAAAVASAVFLVTYSGPIPIKRTPPAAACAPAGQGGTVCLWPSDEYLRPLVTSAYVRARQGAGTLEGFPARLSQFGLAGAGPGTSIHIGDARPTVPGLTRSILDTVVSREGDRLPCGDRLYPDSADAAPITFYIHSILALRAGLPGGTGWRSLDRDIERFMRLDTAAQDRWLEAAIDSLGSCDRAAPKAPLPGWPATR
ncbi:hypothetical protein DP939_09995 [Spongiactinospora rosea]|uniref:Uncharacterized protein n=1 Tax=Spongiactinospora rosea TaxID=2248750 RepID=A0A366M2X3_9ACTN|nr:hypothetical protein [Spongiactinospora rosea]RBQ20143.1 hypothetical protein DP939_09995 [Spongiactinospora rosea]